MLAVTFAKPGGYSYQQPQQQQLPTTPSQINYQQAIPQISQQQLIYTPIKSSVQNSLPASQQSTSFIANPPVALSQSQSNIQIPLSSQNVPLTQQTTLSQPSVQSLLPNQPSTTYIPQSTTFQKPTYFTSNQIPQLTLSETASGSSSSQAGIVYQQIPQLANQVFTLIPQVTPNFNLQNLYQIQSQLPQVTQSSAPAPQQQFLISPQVSPQSPLVTKHVYVHVAPEEPPLPPQIISSPPPRKTYKIIFIKAPSVAAQQPVIHLPAAPAATEEKTLVYVLVDKPQQPQIVVPAPTAAASSKPEVYFVKYKANPKPVLSTATSSVAQTAIVPPQPSVSSGESTSSLFSGGISPKYGPPGYQKREAKM